MFSKSKNDFTEEESQGRQSGSLAWRLSRAETELESSKTIVIKPKPLEEESMIIDILFDITKDIYVRKSNGDEQISGWSNLAFEVDNLLKKEESDWNMVYLARKGNLYLKSTTILPYIYLEFFTKSCQLRYTGTYQLFL